METEKFNDDTSISYDGDFAAAVKEKGDNSVQKALQLLIYMKGKGYEFVGTSSTIAYFKREKQSSIRKPIKRKEKKKDG